MATGEILSAAKENGVRTGKWMLFPSEGEVDGVWKVVVEGTVEGKLGVSAKVATRDDIGVVGEGGGTGGDGGTGGGRSRGGGRERLVCVYTEDFDDEGDVLRVLKKLVEMGLAAGGQARGLYYKCGRSDPFSFLFFFLVYLYELYTLPVRSFLHISKSPPPASSHTHTLIHPSTLHPLSHHPTFIPAILSTHKPTNETIQSTDAFTHLGIESSNEWGLKASLYASKDLLAAEKEKKGKGKGKVTGSKK